MEPKQKPKMQQYERIGILSLEEVFPYIEQHLNTSKKIKIDINGFLVNVSSTRLKTFYKSGIQCTCCDNKASFFAVERSKGNEKSGYHLNLYGYDNDNDEVLFTHDHIFARGLGGEDNLNNTQTMCGPCNWEKGKLEWLLLTDLDDNEKEKITTQLENLMARTSNKQIKVKQELKIN